MSFQFVEESAKPEITVIGIGGAGRNAVNHMMQSGLDGVNFIVIDTNKIGLASSGVSTSIQIGEKLTGGLGTGSLPEIGQAAAKENMEDLKAAIPKSHMFFLATGFGGGTGTGVTPVVAEICRERSDIIVGVVSRPFTFEGKKKQNLAKTGIQALQKVADTTIVIPNDRMRDVAPKGTRLVDIFHQADEVLYHCVKVVMDLISVSGYVNLDFADIKSILKNAGNSIIGMGSGRGHNRALDAVEKAVFHPFFKDLQFTRSQKVLLNITANNDIEFEEVMTVCEKIQQISGPGGEFFWGQTINETLDDELQITLIVTGVSDGLT